MTAAERREREEFETFCRCMQAERSDPREKAYWRLVRKFTVAMVEGCNKERGDALDDAEIIVAAAMAAGAALMYAACSKGKTGLHGAAAEKLIPVVNQAMREAAAKLEAIERPNGDRDDG